MGAAAIPIAIALTAASTGYQIHAGEKQKKEQKRQQDESRKRQDEQSKKQEQLLNEKPKKQIDLAPRTNQRDSFRRGFSSTLKTRSNETLGAPKLSTPALAAGFKTKLGE